MNNETSKNWNLALFSWKVIPYIEAWDIFEPKHLIFNASNVPHSIKIEVNCESFAGYDETGTEIFDKKKKN